MARYLLFLCLFFCGCSPTSLDDFRHEGESVLKEILCDLESIETRDDFAKYEFALKKKFDSLVSILIQARSFMIEHQDLDFELLSTSSSLSDKIQKQLKRLYLMEGGREVIEKAQREAMLRLDSFEKVQKKKGQLRIKG